MEPASARHDSASKNGDGDGDGARKRPPWKILVRLLIYIPLLSYFGWQAARNTLDQRQIADDNFRAQLQQWLLHTPRTIVMPNGETMPVLELTKDEAVEMGLMPADAEKDEQP